MSNREDARYWRSPKCHFSWSSRADKEAFLACFRLGGDHERAVAAHTALQSRITGPAAGVTLASKPRLRSTEFSPAPPVRDRASARWPSPSLARARRRDHTRRAGSWDLARQPASAAAPTLCLDASLLQSVRHPLIARDSIPLESAPLKQPSSGPPVCLLLVYFDALKAGVLDLKVGA